MDFKYAQSWLLGIVCFVYGIYRVIGGSDESFNWVDAAAIFGFCYSMRKQPQERWSLFLK